MALDNKKETILEFRRGMPRITSAAWLSENTIATGHYDGHFVIWDINNGHSVLEQDFGYEIETISAGEGNRILIGIGSGDIYLIDIGSVKPTKLVFAGNNDRFSRTWRLRWVDRNTFVRTSTYGKVGCFKEEANEWSYIPLPRVHSDSVFSVDSFNDLLATGDWLGRVIIWSKSETGYEEKGRIMLSGSVEDISWRSEGSFSAVTEYGHIFYVEQDSKTGNWHIAVDIFISSNNAVSVTHSNSGEMLIAATTKEVIQLDLSTQQIRKVSLEGSVLVRENSVGTFDVVTQEGIFRFAIEAITVPADFVKYKFAKVSVLGRTGVGKSTLCDVIIGKNQFDEQSTYGKRILEWELGYSDPEEKVQKKLVFHDHGGQESELFTFFPHISDSNIVMLLFKRPDLRSFEIVEESIPDVLANTSENTKFFLVETFIDQKKDDVSETRVDRLLAKYVFLEHLRVSAKTDQRIGELKKKLLGTIDWEKARVVFESVESNNILKLLLALKEEGIYVQTIDDIQRAYRERFSSEIPKTHLRFLISNYSTQGIVEYYQYVSDFVVFGGPEYQRLRSDIPAFANLNEGFVTIGEISDHTKGNPELLKVIDALFERTDVHIICGDSRIYPKFLPDKLLQIDRNEWPYNSGDVRTKKFSPQDTNHALLIRALSDLDLTCFGITKNSGLFGWGKNAFIYYSIQTVSDLLSGEQLAVSYVLGGENKEKVVRLSHKVESILEGLYGQEIEIQSNPSANKKKISYEHDIVITYASEQQVYVERVCRSLKRKGIDAWCAPFEQNDLWGQDLNNFFESMYFSKGKMCLMFISDDYVNKVWPRKEKRAALSRQRQDDNYLLPVRFEHTRVPGLNPRLYYYWNWNYTPRELADEVQQKLDKSKNK